MRQVLFGHYCVSVRPLGLNLGPQRYKLCALQCATGDVIETILQILPLYEKQKNTKRPLIHRFHIWHLLQNSNEPQLPLP